MPVSKQVEHVGHLGGTTGSFSLKNTHQRGFPVDYPSGKYLWRRWCLGRGVKEEGTGSLQEAEGRIALEVAETTGMKFLM